MQIRVQCMYGRQIISVLYGRPTSYWYHTSPVWYGTKECQITTSLQP